MGLDLVTPGNQAPDKFNVIIEIPMNADPIKYEVDKATGAIFVDRFMGTAMHYPCNYGYVPRTMAQDGDPVDVLVITPFPLMPGVVVRCRPLGLLKMTDEAGPDSKVLAVPDDKVLPIYSHWLKHEDIIRSDCTRSSISSSTTRTWSRASGYASTAGAALPTPGRKSPPA
jgi:inorganic pyrophosphatase